MCVWNAAACTWPSFLIWQRHQSLKVEATTLQEMHTLAGLQAAEETLDILNMCRRTLFSPSLSSTEGGHEKDVVLKHLQRAALTLCLVPQMSHRENCCSLLYPQPDRHIYFIYVEDSHLNVFYTPGLT